ncbi:MAG: MmcQ/YjbR family DNA-binding protein [Acidimicrobiia bacterium]
MDAARPTDPQVWARLRAICDGLPLASVKTSHGELTWFVGHGKRPKQFASTWDHHHDDRNGVVMAAPLGVQEQLVGADPVRYFRPPYLGSRGWIGIYLDEGNVDWDLVERHLADAHAALNTG